MRKGIRHIGRLLDSIQTIEISCCYQHHRSCHLQDKNNLASNHRHVEIKSRANALGSPTWLPGKLGSGFRDRELRIEDRGSRISKYINLLFFVVVFLFTKSALKKTNKQTNKNYNSLVHHGVQQLSRYFVITAAQAKRTLTAGSSFYLPRE